MKALERRVVRLESEFTPKRFAPWAEVPMDNWPDAVLEDFLRATCPDLAGAGVPLSDELLLKLIHDAEAAVQPNCSDRRSSPQTARERSCCSHQI